MSERIIYRGADLLNKPVWNYGRKDELNRKIVELRYRGMKFRDIAASVERDLGQVYKIWKRDQNRFKDLIPWKKKLRMLTPSGKRYTIKIEFVKKGN